MYFDQRCQDFCIMQHHDITQVYFAAVNANFDVAVTEHCGSCCPEFFHRLTLWLVYRFYMVSVLSWKCSIFWWFPYFNTPAANHFTWSSSCAVPCRTRIPLHCNKVNREGWISVRISSSRGRVWCERPVSRDSSLFSLREKDVHMLAL